jgi:hypothetical protein
MIQPSIARRRSEGGAMKRSFLLIPLVLTGCSQSREERRETAKTCLLAPLVLAGMLLDGQTHAEDSIQNMIDQQNSMQPGGYAVTKHLVGDTPDIPK